MQRSFGRIWGLNRTPDMAGVIAVIPARCGSKGVPDKNILDVAGRPLVAYSIMAAVRATAIDRVIVSTDSERYAQIARSYGGEVPFLRPPELAEDTSTDFDFVRHLLDGLGEKDDALPELIVHLRPTTPLRDPDRIDAAIEWLRGKPEATAVRSVHQMSESAYKTFEIVDGRLVAICTQSADIDASNNARQGFPETFAANGYVDVLRTSYILQNGRLHGNRVEPFMTEFVDEIDTELDLEMLRSRVHLDPTMVERVFGPDD